MKKWTKQRLLMEYIIARKQIDDYYILNIDKPYDTTMKRYIRKLNKIHAEILSRMSH